VLDNSIGSDRLARSGGLVEAIMSHIDRIFCTSDFYAKFPLTRARALPKNTSDHVPIMWLVGHDGNVKNSIFKLEKWWLQHSEFKEIVK
jgi:hypothetical protein